MRLEPTRLRALHLLPDFTDGMGVHALGSELAFGYQLFDGIHIDDAIDLAEQLSLCLGTIAVADRIDEQVAQRMAFEQLAENVVNFAAERGARLFEFFQQTTIDLALACIGSAKIPEMTHFRLADAMDAAEALFEAVRVPR